MVGEAVPRKTLTYVDGMVMSSKILHYEGKCCLWMGDVLICWWVIMIDDMIR